MDADFHLQILPEPDDFARDHEGEESLFDGLHLATVRVRVPMPIGGGAQPALYHALAALFEAEEGPALPGGLSARDVRALRRFLDHVDQTGAGGKPGAREEQGTGGADADRSEETDSEAYEMAYDAADAVVRRLEMALEALSEVG